jgi:hypothetical protein
MVKISRGSLWAAAVTALGLSVELHPNLTHV